jgi:hypothetical protein
MIIGLSPRLWAVAGTTRQYSRCNRHATPIDYKIPININELP